MCSSSVGGPCCTTAGLSPGRWWWGAGCCYRLWLSDSGQSSTSTSLWPTGTVLLITSSSLALTRWNNPSRPGVSSRPARKTESNVQQIDTFGRLCPRVEKAAWWAWAAFEESQRHNTCWCFESHWGGGGSNPEQQKQHMDSQSTCFQMSSSHQTQSSRGGWD